MCPLCNRVEKLKQNNDPAFIHEFEDSYLVLGDHQYYPGYSVLVFKDHVSDLADISEKSQEVFLKNGVKAAKILKDIYKPYKMNYAVLGNEVEHVHLHLIPRYQEELENAKEKHPWHNAKKFKDYALADDELKKEIEKIKYSFKDLK